MVFISPLPCILSPLLHPNHTLGPFFQNTFDYEILFHGMPTNVSSPLSDLAYHSFSPPQYMAPPVMSLFSLKALELSLALFSLTPHNRSTFNVPNPITSYKLQGYQPALSDHTSHLNQTTLPLLASVPNPQNIQSDLLK